MAPDNPIHCAAMHEVHAHGRGRSGGSRASLALDRSNFWRFHRPMKPRAVLETWIARFNAADIEGLTSLYASNAVNHQVALEPVVGRAAIREMFIREFGAAEMVCVPVAIHEAGDVVALEWKDPRGLRGCGFFTVHDGLITHQRGYWDRLSFLKLYDLPLEASWREK